MIDKDLLLLLVSVLIVLQLPLEIVLLVSLRRSLKAINHSLERLLGSPLPTGSPSPAAVSSKEPLPAEDNLLGKLLPEQTARSATADTVSKAELAAQRAIKAQKQQSKADKDREQASNREARKKTTIAVVAFIVFAVVLYLNFGRSTVLPRDIAAANGGKLGMSATTSGSTCANSAFSQSLLGECKEDLCLADVAASYLFACLSEVHKRDPKLSDEICGKPYKPFVETHCSGSRASLCNLVTNDQVNLVCPF